MEYEVKIDEFEGPLDLLLHLIKEDNIDIYDISIERITKQYLDYINHMESLNINVGANYLIMACELMEIKSNSLLPKVKKEEDEEEVLSTDSLINKLVEYKKYKEVTKDFKQLEDIRMNIYIKSPEKVSLYTDTNVMNEASVDDLILAFEKYLERKNMEKPLTTKVTNKEYSVKDRKNSIRDILKLRKKVEFSELFLEYNKSYIVVSFLSILELAKEEEIYINQENNFDNIYIERRDI